MKWMWIIYCCNLSVRVFTRNFITCTSYHWKLILFRTRHYVNTNVGCNCMRPRVIENSIDLLVRHIMTRLIFLSTCVLLLNSIFGQQSKIASQHTIHSRVIKGDSIKLFIDSIKSTILSDTSKFNREDLTNANGRTGNKKSYSLLFFSFILFGSYYLLNKTVLQPKEQLA